MPAISPVAAPAPTTAPRGKSAMAPGQQAKAAVAAARAAGVDMPANAQGLAASQIAKGADAGSLFAMQIAALTPEPVAAASLDPAPPGDAIAAYAFNAPAIEATVLPSADPQE